MRSCASILIPFALLVHAAKADNTAAARSIIDEAIAAHGGEAALAKWPTVIMKTEGIFHGYERTPVFFFKSQIASHAPEQSRHDLDGDLHGQKFRIVNVFDGKQGWIKMAGNEKDITRKSTAAELEDSRQGAYVNWLCTLLPLKRENVSLSLADDENAFKEPAVGIRVSGKGHRDVTLFFDKKTHLLVKTDTRSRGGTGVEGKFETFYQQHKNVDGVVRPMMLTTYHDGHQLMSHWVLEYQLAEDPKPGTFEKP